MDRDPLTVALAAANVAALGLADRVEARCADVTAISLAGVDAAFVDPARRGPQAGPSTRGPTRRRARSCSRSLTGLPATGAKLAPGVPHAALPVDAEAEWVSEGGDVLECALWCGPLSTGVRRRATLLPTGATLTGDGTREAAAGPVGRYL